MKTMITNSLMNQSGDDKETFLVVTIDNNILNDSINSNGSAELKDLIREKINNLFCGCIYDFFDDLPEKEVEDCIDELSKGQEWNIRDENFWWERNEVICREEKAWVLTQESNVNGEVFFNTVVCKNKEAALKKLEQEKEWIRKECVHFKDYHPEDENLTIEEGKYRFFIMDNTDDYYEELNVTEKDIL